MTRPENKPSKFPGQRIGIGLAAEEGRIIGRKDYSRKEGIGLAAEEGRKDYSRKGWR